MDSRCFSKAFVVEFLELYRSLPSLWNVKCVDYSNRDRKQKAYQILVDKLKEVDPGATKEMVVKKIDSFRGSFRKELRKMEELNKSGEDVIYKPKLWYFDNLVFLRDQVGQAAVKSMTLTMDEFTAEELMAIKVEDSQFSDEHSIDYIADETSLGSIFSPVTSTPSVSGADTLVSTLAPCKEVSNRKRQVATCDEETVKRVCVHLDKPDIFNDEFTVMGTNITNKLRKLPPEAVSVTEKLITDILFEAQCGNINQYTRVNLIDSRRQSNLL